MNKDKKEHQTIGDLVQDFVKKNKRLERGLDELNIQEIWNTEMGPGIKKYTTDIKLNRETLYVQLNNSVLREELSYGKPQIIKMLNNALKKDLIKKLVLR